jgi:hypothetical protein
VIITAATAAEADLLHRRLPALRWALGPDVEIVTNLQGDRLEELLGQELAAVDLEHCYELPAER